MDNKLNSELLSFIAASPSAWHTVENVAQRLGEQGYVELFENESWRLSPGGKYFLRRNGSSLIAFRLPESELRGYMIMAAHGDSPSFKIKEEPETQAAGLYRMLSVEKYGSMICSSWLDRPLSVAGRAVIRDGDRLVTRLVNIDRDLLLIPSLAIHMERSVNDNKSYNANVDMLPLFSSLDSGADFKQLVAESLGVEKQALVYSDLFLYCRQEGRILGAEGEYISSPRLDDLQCAFACMEGFLSSEESCGAPVLCIFDNEEVGSGTKQGAGSDFLADTLQRIWRQQLGARDYESLLADSFMVSADNAHAVHPNHPELSDRNDRPRINGGVVIKFNANGRYTSDAVSATVFAQLCSRAGVPVQHFSNRADMPGGSTLGNISSAHVAVDCVDVGLAQLAMHSACETAGARDTGYLIQAAREFYSSWLCRQGQSIEIIKGKLR